ncbi:MAG: M20/M25/M40 family metallo-hydrolase [Acidimicrobiales bacterium]
MSAPDTLVAEVLDRTRVLAQTPAPSFHEGDRAALVSGWWAEWAAEVDVDAVGNVWARVRPGDGPAVVVAAHLDTVFSADFDHSVVERDGHLFGPSVGDDSVAVAALGALDALLPPDPGGPVWVLATVGEEGLGNLTGIRHALSAPPVEIGAVIALEGNWLGRVCSTAVGSVRRRVTLRGPGGHAWEASEAPSAVHGVARVVATLDSAQRPIDARTAVNVGRIGGGTAINARADHAWFDVDLRAESQAALDELVATLESTVAAAAGDFAIEVESLGDRPAGAIDPTHPLVLAALEALDAAGIVGELTAASTDANAAHPVGVPAIALGVTRGGGEHTPDEWIETAPLGRGLSVLAATITTYLRRTT